MERAEINHFVDLLTAKRTQLEAILSELKAGLPERDIKKYPANLGWHSWPLDAQLGLFSDDIRANIDGAIEEIDYAVRQLESAEADDEKAPESWPTFRSRGPLPERFAGLRGAA